MSECCPAAAALGFASCPHCNSKGVPIELQTVKALLLPEALSRLNVTHHRFCPEATCDAVYFDEVGSVFSRKDLRVPVWQKEPFGQRVICYCFGEGEATLRTEIEEAGVSHAVERVRVHVAARRCACDIRNPKSSCCLGDLIAAVKRVEESILLERTK